MSYEYFRDGSENPEAPMSYEHDRALAAKFAEEAWLRIITNCPVNKHVRPQGLLACKHCMNQDEEHPVGMVFTHDYFMMCRTCFDLMERKHFIKSKEIVLSCRPCIFDELGRIMRKNPTLFTNHSSILINPPL